MDTLYVLESGSYLRKEGDCLKVIRKGEVLDTIPARGLKHLCLAGRTSLSGAVLDFLIQNRIDTVFLTYTGRFRGRLLLDEPGHVARRRAQYLRLNDQAPKTEMARIIVGGKLENQARLLIRRGYRQNSGPLRQAGAQIKALQARLARAENVEEIRGIEGFGSNIFFESFSLLIRNQEFSFKGRNRRPPRDPVNALLSFVYTLFTNEVVNAIQRTGLDPYLGALHEIVHGRPSLACDLVEEWRVHAERLVLTLINRRVLGSKDFVRGKDAGDRKRPVLMKPKVSRALIAAYYRLLDETHFYPPTGEKVRMRWIIHRQCLRFAECLENEDMVYEPFLIGR